MHTEEVKNKYNRDIAEKYNNQYEQGRWFKNDIQKAGYEMTLSAIKNHALTQDFTDCFELGPGHGTWTKELLAYQPKAEYVLLDISSAMLDLLKKRFVDQENIKYIESDFLEFKPDKRYDFFFSSRALEYIPDKKEAVKKIISLIKPGGRGFIITKTPKYLRAKLMGIEVPEFHRGQIAPDKLKDLLHQNSAKEIKIYPVTLSWPFLRSPKMNMRLYRFFGQQELNFLSQFFAESYCVSFVL